MALASVLPLLLVRIAEAEDAPAPDTKPSGGGFAELRSRSKHPTPWLEWGADLRLRNTFTDNIMTLSSSVPRHAQHFYRVRPRVSLRLTPVENLGLDLRLALESRYWARPSGSVPHHTGWDWNEIVFDRFNLYWSEIGHSGLTFRVGRQDLSFGDRWLVFEGTPLDGPVTLFFDAARATYEWKERKTTIDAIYVDQGARNDRWLPPLRVSKDAVDGAALPIEKALVEQNERAVILYLVSRSPRRQVDGYLVYRGNRQETVRDSDNDALRTHLLRGDEGDLYTVGSRMLGAPSPTWRWRAELTFQAGRRNGTSVRAFGLNSAVFYTPKVKSSPELRAFYEFLSGDDPDTADRHEGFDVLWGRWDRFSQLYVYTYAPETRISQYGNLHRLGAGVTLRPTSKLEWLADYHLLYADETPAPSTFVSGQSRFRGHLLNSAFRARLGPSLAGLLWTEVLFPGAFYFAGDATNPARRDTAVCVRAELNLAW